MTQKHDKILIWAFLIFLGGMMVLNLLTPDRVFSLRENRYLARRPHLTLRTLMSGRFPRQFEEYITDEFALRDHWVLIKSDLERLLLRRENNGIFFGSDGYLLEDFRRPEAALARNIEQINRFALSFPEIPVHVLLAPNSVAVYPDKLPLFAEVYDQTKVLHEVHSKLLKEISWVPVYAALRENRGESLYYRTDHHWTMRGAYYAYRELAKSLDFAALPPADFQAVTVAGDFWGTYYSKANNRYLKSDFIEVLLPKTPAAVEIRFNDKAGVFDSLYFPQHLETRDKYAYFLDGNHPLTVITTDVKNGRRLAVFKDSYAHSLLPFLAQHYQEIHVIDLRFFSNDLGRYLEEQQIDQALFLFNVAGFARDNTLVNFK